MKSVAISFIIIMVVYVCLFLYFCYKNGKLLKTLMLSCLSGLAVFTVVNLLSDFTGVYIPVNWYTTGSAATFGVPGVLCLLTLRMIL